MSKVIQRNLSTRPMACGERWRLESDKRFCGRVVGVSILAQNWLKQPSFPKNHENIIFEFFEKNPFLKKFQHSFVSTFAKMLLWASKPYIRPKLPVVSLIQTFKENLVSCMTSILIPATLYRSSTLNILLMEHHTFRYQIKYQSYNTVSFCHIHVRHWGQYNIWLKCSRQNNHTSKHRPISVPL